MSTKHTALRRFAAGAGALALALAGFAGVGTAAMADDNDPVGTNIGPDQPGAPVKGTLTINKYSGGPVGQGETPDQDNLLDGVEFTVTRVGKVDGGTCVPLDLTNASHWDGLEVLFDRAPAAPADPFCLTTTVQDDVTSDGKVTFTLDVGIYLVQETDPGDNPIVSKVPDFYVSIPTSLGEGGAGWTYDVVADPKNQLMDVPSKTIDEDQVDLVVGSDVTWTLNVPIPTLNNNETFTEAVITDTLDSRLTYVAGSSTVTIDSDPATSLVEGTHYNVTGNAVWTLTESGRALLDSNQGKNLIIEFDTTVTSVGDGSIPNDDYGSTFNGTTVPGDDEPHTYWGQLSILKTDDSETALPLAGAEFQVFDAAGAQCPATVPAGDPVAIGVSGDDGIVLWDYTAAASSPLGLWIANSDEPLTSPTKDYCVYETVVPSGHSADVITNPVTITAGEDNVKALTVVNPKTDGPDLPLTGAQGTLLMTVGGLVLVGVGGGALALTRRRKTE